jgi:hypothetical protein
MRRAAIVMGMLAAAWPAGDALASDCIFIPPVRVDVGPATSQLDATAAFQTVAGIHWASVYPKGKARFDVGVGIVSISRLEEEPPAMTTDPEATARRGPVSEPLELTGGYVEVAARTAGNHWWRTWVAGRVESGRATRDGEHEMYVGFAARVSTEAYLAGMDGGGNALVMGVAAIGVYGELAVRRHDQLGDDLTASAGLSFRIPLIVGG